ncbi:1-phosphofructokinase family hexose kinase [Fusobacterium varium]|uniref:1-phosphofructokinase family hexose kinase n=1 Tax=Fusobacterium varium TaxID=856 RepID=UPI0030D3ED77
MGFKRIHTIINEASKRGIKFILDTSGDTLIKGIEAKPFLIKPNQDELEDMFNKKFSTVNEIIEAARKIVKKGVKNVMVTLGGNGAVLVTENEVYRAFLPKVEIKNTVGSGDSVIGGFAHGISEGKSLRESFKLGIACGTTNAMLETTGSIDLKILNNILKNIEISNV